MAIQTIIYCTVPSNNFVVLYDDVLHTIEDILENAEMFSIEYILWQLFDHDSFQNFVGDILSGLVGSVIIFILYAKMIK